MDEDKIKPSQRKTVRDAEKRRKRERMVEGLRRLPEMPVPPRKQAADMVLNPSTVMAKAAEGTRRAMEKAGISPVRGVMAPGLGRQERPAGMKKGGKVKKGYHKMPDGKIMKDSAHKKTAKCTRGDGCAKKGKTKGRMV
jgi:hypothetical protein